ncbi:crossover junction endodeoxyribonuclease RuvC [Actinopolymorpha sp. B11F2]|uniref:crossover junction endodeoxyribonuclease RuvC n=1 Tax=Actinopolymorpha sp. B11F2 TaxID=3160862 RepID=UPI0032E47489
MRVLGIDPGLTRCGLGLVESEHPRRLGLLAVDVVRTHPDLALGGRLLEVERVVASWLDEHTPDAVALERVFSQHNVRTVMGTAQVSGVILTAAARRGIPVALHTPSEVKAAVTGNGRAGKEQVTHMVTRILSLPAKPRPADAADALALAICHLWRGPAAARIEAARQAAAGRSQNRRGPVGRGRPPVVAAREAVGARWHTAAAVSTKTVQPTQSAEGAGEPHRKGPR